MTGKISGFSQKCAASTVSCYDSDNGKEYFVKGYSINEYGIRWDDWCNPNDGKLVETYCNGANVNFISYECPNGCRDGVCILPSPYIGVVSGEKSNYYTGERIKLVIKAIEGDGSPAEFDEGFYLQYYTYDTLQPEGYLQEYIPSNYNGWYDKPSGSWLIDSWAPQKEGRYYTEILFYCSRDTKCSNDYPGLDIRERLNFIVDSYPPTHCTDTDGGRDYYTKGTFSGLWQGQQITNTDYCVDALDETGHAVTSSNYLGEGYCENNQLKVERITCPNGCNNGVCLPSTCTESDNGKYYYSKGTIIGIDKPTGRRAQATDICDDQETLKEYFCDGIYVIETEYLCPYGCYDGACINEEKPQKIGFAMHTDRREYDYGETVIINMKLYDDSRSANIDNAAINAWVALPFRETREQLEIKKVECIENELRNVCYYQSSYNIPLPTRTQITGGVVAAPTGKITSDYTEKVSLIDKDTLLVSESVIDPSKPTDSWIAYPSNRYVIYAAAEINGNALAAKADFYVLDSPKQQSGYLDLKKEYASREEIDFIMVNKGDTVIEVLYTDSRLPLQIEKYNGKSLEGLNINDPCRIRTPHIKSIKIGPNERASIGTWNQKVYSNACENTLNRYGEEGMYVVTLQYRAGGRREILKQRFIIGDSLDCRPICLYQGSRAEGWYDSCTNELISYGKCSSERPTIDCNGCLFEDTCLPFGTRIINSEDISEFCDVNKAFAAQKDDNSPCQNNFECLSNTCASGVCTDLTKELKETRNLIQMLLDWLARLFG